jgi:hypothetical protein
MGPLITYLRLLAVHVVVPIVHMCSPERREWYVLFDFICPRLMVLTNSHRHCKDFLGSTLGSEQNNVSERPSAFHAFDLSIFPPRLVLHH